MPPRTNAERQRAYRERLKRERPEKFEEIRIKHLAKIKESNKNKKGGKQDQGEQQEKRKAKKAGKKGKNKDTKKHDDDAKLQEKTDKIEGTEITDKLQTVKDKNSELLQCNDNLENTCDRVRKEMDNITRDIARSKIVD